MILLDTQVLIWLRSGNSRLVATALGGHQLVTADGKILGWPGPLNRLDAKK